MHEYEIFFKYGKSICVPLGALEAECESDAIDKMVDREFDADHYSPDIMEAMYDMFENCLEAHQI